MNSDSLRENTKDAVFLSSSPSALPAVARQSSEPPAVSLEQKMRVGSPHPRGATWDGHGVNFALFSANATRVELCIFDPTGTHELRRYDLPEFTEEIWHGYLPAVGPGTVYGYRVHGPYAPDEGHRFNPNKLLLDPYARAHIGRMNWNDACYGYTIGATTKIGRAHV